MIKKLFPSQEPGEKIYLVVRQHWVYLAQRLLIWVIFVAFILFFKHYMPTVLPQLFTGTAGLVTGIFTQVYSLFLVLSLFIIWVLYYLNIQIITDVRIVDIMQEGLFNHTLSELHINRIQDVTSEIKGVLGTLFGFGNVFVQTAGALERFVFNNVPRPNAIEKLILDLVEKQEPHGLNGPPGMQ